MKKYQSHKIVEAGQIDHTERRDDNRNFLFVDVGGTLRDVEVPADFFARGEPADGDYLVRYQPDGYLSWSPKAVFEAGYREVKERGTPAAVEVTVTAPAGKRAAVLMSYADVAETAWTVTGGKSQRWSLIGDETLTVHLDDDHETVAHKRDAS
jgi:hypothetical protein